MGCSLRTSVRDIFDREESLALVHFFSPSTHSVQYLFISTYYMPSTGPEAAMRQRHFKTCSLSPKPLDMDPNNGDISLAVLSVLENPQTVAAAFV